MYRSAYKNARRLAATESNIAYRTADYERWQQLDFVVGIRVVLSNNHTLNGEPFSDICDRLSAPLGSKATKGRGCYPKDFKFTGWHPLCRCHTETILKTIDEMRADEARILAGEPVSTQSENTVDDVPQEFKDWVEENEERIERAKSLPYFIRDNFSEGNIGMGLKSQSIAQLPKTNAFAKATSMEEVVERLKRLGIKDIELGADLTLAEANIALEAVEEEGKNRALELNKFGIASNLHRRADLRAVQKQEVGGFYNSEKKILYIDANIFRQSIYRNPKSWEERIDELEIKIVKAKEDIAKYEGYLGKNKKFDKELKGYISNAKQQILGFEKQIYQYNEYKKQGITPFTKLVAEQFEAIELQAKAQIHHEFGHYVDDILGRPSSNIKGVHQSISEYGNKYANEGFAEWYTHYRMKGAKGLPEDLKLLFKNYDNEMPVISHSVITPLTKAQKQRRTEIRQIAKTTIANKPIMIPTLNKTATISNEKIKEWLNQPHKYIVEKNESLLSLENLINNGEYIDSGVDKHDPTVSAHLIQVAIANENSWIVIRELNDGTLRIHSVSDNHSIINNLIRKKP